MSEFDRALREADMDSGCLVGRRYCLTLDQAVAFSEKCTREVAV